MLGDVIQGTGNDTVHVDGTSLAPATILGSIAFNESATTGNDSLFVDNYGTVAGSITEGAAGILDVKVASLGSLSILNTASSLTVRNFDVANAATLNLSVSSNLVNTALQNIAVVNASQEVTIGDTVKFGVAYSCYIPTAGNFILLQAPIGQLHISQSELTAIDISVGDTVPFLFTSASGICGYNLPGVTACMRGLGAGTLSSELVLDLVPKTAAQLGLTGYALQLFPYAQRSPFDRRDAGFGPRQRRHDKSAGRRSAYSAASRLMPAAARVRSLFRSPIRRRVLSLRASVRCACTAHSPVTTRGGVRNSPNSSTTRAITICPAIRIAALALRWAATCGSADRRLVRRRLHLLLGRHQPAGTARHPYRHRMVHADRLYRLARQGPVLR